MAKKNSDQNPIKNANSIPEDAYVTWGDDIQSKKDALRATSDSLEDTGIQKAAGMRRYGLDYSNLDGFNSGRPGLTRSDYYFFRPDEAPPVILKEIIKIAEDIYQ